MRNHFHTVRLLFFCLLLTSFANADSDRERPDGPHPLKPADHLIGRLIRDISFVDVDGQTGRFSDYASSEALVIALNKVNCPLSRKYAATLNAIEKHYASRNVTFLYVNVNKHVTLDELREGIRALGYSARYLPDLENEIGKSLAAMTSTEVFILDKARTLVYRGPINDQYGVTYSLPAPRRHHLRDALESHLCGQKINAPAWAAPGCALGFPADTTPAKY